MNIVSIECPNCGGKIERNKNEYFANCPYCGTEVCFDEIKGETQFGQINDLKDRVEEFEERERIDSEGRDRIKKWRKWRNITFTGFFVLTFLSFLFVGISTSPNPENDTLVGIGAVIFILLFILFFAGPPALASKYPDYDLIEGKVRFHDRLIMFGKLEAIAVGISILSAFAVYAVLSVFGRV